MSGRQAFPWTSNDITFKSRGDLERTIESFVGAGKRVYVDAAKTLLREAIGADVINTDQYNDIKARLHL
jgi:hypothetical protein